MNKIDLVIVDDHRLFRNGLKSLFKDMDFINEVGEASNGKEFLEYLEVHRVDLVLMDINMPIMNGIEATQQAQKKYPDLKIIGLSMLSDEDYYFKMIEAGASGFILKDAGCDELVAAIESVMSGQNYFSQELLRNVIISLSSANKTIDPKEDWGFTERELDVLLKMCKGLSNQEIADALFISPRTVERHRANLFLKTGAKNAVALVMYAIRNNLVSV